MTASPSDIPAPPSALPVTEAAQLIPLLPLKTGVLYPGVGMPFSVGRDGSLAAVEAAVSRDHKDLIVCGQRAADADPADIANLYRVGVRGQVRTVQRTQQTVTVIVQGLERVAIDAVVGGPRMVLARVRPLPLVIDEGPDVEALSREALVLVHKLVRLAKGGEVPALDALLRPEEDRQRFVFTVASLLGLDPPKGQELLEQPSVSDALRYLHAYLTEEVQVLEIRQEIAQQVAGQMDKEQREYVLRKQLKTIQDELGEAEPELAEVRELGERLSAAQLPEHVMKEAERELRRLQRMPSASHEHHVIRGYIELVLELPWNNASQTKVDLATARAVLDADHYGLQDVKERILEHLAVLKLNPTAKAPIICFLGPPGVGKTSLGQSIARALGRKFERMSLGGLHDEAELRGHRRTYVGAMPGRIIQAIRRAGVSNPLLMLDEVDKLGRDFRGDPAAALLEILDPEQNHQFRDNYLDIPFDLSRVLFITTCNSLDSIPRPLLDRMEVVRLSGYSEEEKEQIAHRYLIVRQLERAGVLPEFCAFEPGVIGQLVRRYTREAGVRQLERVIGRIIRKAAVRFAEGRTEPVRIAVRDLPALLGPEPFFGDDLRTDLGPGIAAGLAWTEVGGAMMYVETALTPGKNELTLTGQLGDVMQESAKAALTCVGSRAERLGVGVDRMRQIGAHVHVPSGAVPKDGPSAGVTIAAALASLYTGCPVRGDTAMTGEITISGLVLPVGGIKDKLLAARRAGIRQVILPRENEKDLRELDEVVLRDLRLTFVDRIEQVWAAAMPELANRLGVVPAGDGRRRSAAQNGLPNLTRSPICRQR